MNVEDIVKYIKSLDDLNTLKRIKRVIDDRIRELRIMGNEWTQEAIEELWDRLSDDQRKLIKYLAGKEGTALKSEILRDFGWKEMKTSGVLAGINTQARNMRFVDVITRKHIRKNGEWDIKYELNRNWLDFIRRFE